MALTPGVGNGTTYVQSSDLVANYPAASLALANKVDTKLDNALTPNPQAGTTYTFSLGDARQLVTATNAAAKTFTIPPQASVAWIDNSTIRVVNYGAGALTIAAGAGVTVTNVSKTLAQFESAGLVRTGLNAWTLVPFGGGVGNADFSNAATGTYTGFKYVTFTGSGTLTVTRAGLCDVVVVAGGGGAPNRTDNVSYGFGGGGAGGVIQATGYYLAVGTYTVTIGAGGIGQAEAATDSALGTVLTAAGGTGLNLTTSGTKAGSGSGGPQGGTGGGGTLNQGNAGGAGTSPRGGGGGGSGGVGLATNPPNGGPGTTTAIAGTTPAGAYVAGTYAIGGGGGGGGVASTGGTGGGGNGAAFGVSPTNGTANRGGGGGGGGGNNAGPTGTNGGSGIVIVRVAV